VNGGVKSITTGTRVLTFDSVSKDLVAAGTSADFDHPQDVVRYSLKSPAQIATLTDVNGDVLAGKQLAKIEEIWYTSSGNTKVQGWIVKPPSFDASKKYPLILEIHGGPFGNYNVGFNYMFQNFAANGFVVLVTITMLVMQRSPDGMTPSLGRTPPGQSPKRSRAAITLPFAPTARPMASRQRANSVSPRTSTMRRSRWIRQ